MKINIHYSFLFLILFGLFSGLFLEIMIFIIVVCLHELSHIFTSVILGKKVKRITLTIIGGIVDMEEVDSEPVKNLIISISGVLMNGFLILLSKIINNEYYRELILNYNKMMMLINILPIYPLDGYRIIDSIAYGFFSTYRTIKTLICLSIIFVILFILYGIYNKSFGLLIIGIFLGYRNIQFYFMKEKVFLKRLVYNYRIN